MDPTISIIVPIYNLEPYLETCVDSILNQTFKDIEIILVNDGSTDNSGKICDLYAQKDFRVRVIHKEFGGVSSARNAGIKASLGEFVGFVDGDDRIDQNMYGTLYESCLETNSDIGICKLGREINGHLINVDTKKFIKEMDHTEALRQLFKGVLFRFSLCNKLFKKSCFENVTFPEGRIHEDLSTTYRLFANSRKAIFTNYLGYFYIKRKNSILTSQYNEKRLEAFLGWDEILPFMYQKYPDLYQEVINCFAYWALDNVYYVINQLEDKELKNDYLIKIQKHIKKYYKDIIKCDHLNLTYKRSIRLINYNLSLFYFFYLFKGFFRKQG